MGTNHAVNVSAIGDALFTASRQAVLRTLFGHAERRFYQRQLIRMLGLGTGAVQRELVNLAQAGIISRTVEGRQTYFQANRGSPVFTELRSLVRKTLGVAGVLQAALQPLVNGIRIAFVYGSVASDRERADSDIDVMLVGDDLSLDDVVSALAQAQEIVGREVNPSVYSTAEFCRKLSEGQHFLTRVIKDPKVFLIGDDDELTRLAKVRLAHGARLQPAGNQRPVQRRRPRP